MEKDLILQEIKKQILDNGGEPKELLTIQANNVEVGEEHRLYCRKYQYACTGVGQKFGGDIRFPLTKKYTSNAKWFYEGDKTSAENFLITYIGDKSIFEELGGCYEEGNSYNALRDDAFEKLREELKMYNCRALYETVRIDDFEEISQSSPVYIPIYWKNNGRNILIGYVVKYDSGERVILSYKKSNNLCKTDKGPNWFLIILGLFFPPILLIYLIYLLSRKK